MKTYRRLAALTLALGYAASLAALVASAACASAPAAQPATPRTDAEIAAAVKTQLATDSKINPFAVQVDVRDGTVTLSGRVPDAETRDRAERLARGVAGVRGVINLLTSSDA